MFLVVLPLFVIYNLLCYFVAHLKDNTEPCIRTFVEKTEVHMSDLSPELIKG